MTHRIQARGLLLSVALGLAGCGGGADADSLDSVADRDLSGIAGPSDPDALRPVSRVPRELFGAANDARHLIYPEADEGERRFLNPVDPASPLRFFITEHSPTEGVGPIFNQPRCLGCHLSQDDIKAAVAETAGALWSEPAALNTVSTPVSRAGRQGVTDHGAIDTDHPPPTAAFTLFGDFNPATGGFDPLTVFGGPIRHVRATGACEADVIPPQSVDPNLAGGTDPLTGLSSVGVERAIGERAAPPYIGRGLIEAVYAADIVANEDPDDALAPLSTLDPPVDPAICPGDCISGRHNENRADNAFVGGDPVVRVARFGLRGAGPTLLQFVVGGTQGEIGMTSPFAPAEQNNNQNVGKHCDGASDPKLTADQVLDLRTLLRLLGIPDVAPELLEETPSSPLAMDVQAGARLFGVDLDAFQSRMIDGATPIGKGDPDADHGIAADRQLGCVSCHVPILPTGESPAGVGGELLSQRWAPLFSDLLIHDMGRYPLAPAKLTPQYQGISRNLADFALPGQGLAFGTEWRTPPLMGIGKTGAPFLHDARVFLNVGSPASLDTSYAGNVNTSLVVGDLDSALLAAIELHDLPSPPAGATGEPDDSLCPPPYLGSEEYDICRRNSRNRGEARNVMEKWRHLTRERQLLVVQFLKSL